MQEWDILVDAILGPASIEADRADKKIVGKYKDEFIDQSRFFIRPEHRRRGVKWIQTTKETDKLFLLYKMRDDIHETMYQVIGKHSGQIDDKSCNETFRCFMTTPVMTTTATAMPVTITEKSTPPENNMRETFLNTFLRNHLKKIYEPSKRKALQSEQGGFQVDSDIDLQCDPNQR